MALSRARAFQEQAKLTEEKSKQKDIEKLFQLKVVKPGDAANFPKFGDSVAINYIAYLEDGTCIDNSLARGMPLNFILGAGQVIAALELVLLSLSRGERARIVVPPEYGYGDKGYPPIIPPKSVLLYEIELVTFSSVGSAEKILREKKESDPFAT